MNLYLKWTNPGRVPPVQGGRAIPKNRWTARVNEPIICLAGWHACRWEDAVHHIADELWVCELDGPIVEGPDKVVAGRLKLVERVGTINDRTLRLFAADCAESVLHLYERDHPDDNRPRLAIEAARRFANGEIDAAAWSAAWSAARSAAESAWPAARSAAWSAAGSAAWVAQNDRLLTHYAQLDPLLFAHWGQS